MVIIIKISLVVIVVVVVITVDIIIMGYIVLMYIFFDFNPNITIKAALFKNYPYISAELNDML